MTGINPRIGYMFARDALLPWRTTLANILFVAEVGGKKASAHRQRALELVRLAVPRRVYSSRQLEQAADAAADVLSDPGSVPGLELVNEAPVLRHFTARFRPL